MRPSANAAALAATALSLALLAGAARAGPLQRLPPDRALAQGDGSPGSVTFSHATHVDEAAPRCLACHPRAFRMLEPGKTGSGAAILHREMESGTACGACHGKTAFGFESCELCHK